jgi:hypothetical protein
MTQPATPLLSEPSPTRVGLNTGWAIMQSLFLPIALAMLLTACGSKQEEGFHVTPTIDTTSPTGVYIPKDIPDAHQELLKMLPKKVVEKLKNGTPQEIFLYENSLGLWIRNNWRLWGTDSRLKENLVAQGFLHPDDMSGVIMGSFIHYLRGESLGVEQAAARCKRQYSEWQNTLAEKTNSTAIQKQVVSPAK